MFRTLFRTLSSRPVARTSRTTARLTLEALEDRQLLSTIPVAPIPLLAASQSVSMAIQVVASADIAMPGTMRKH